MAEDTYYIGEIEAEGGPAMVAQALATPSATATVPPPIPRTVRADRSSAPQEPAHPSARSATPSARSRIVSTPAPAPAPWTARFAPPVSLVVPGGGQMLRGESAYGLFFGTSTVLLLTLGWALLDTQPRLLETLPLLGLPTILLVWGACALYAGVAWLHLANALQVAPRDLAPGRHPAVPAVASALLPGAGQLLNGHRARAGLFLGAVWAVGALWLCASVPVQTWLFESGAVLPDWLLRVATPPLLYVATGVLWALAVYDAAASARR